MKSVDSGRRGVDAVPSRARSAPWRDRNRHSPKQYEAPEHNERAVPCVVRDGLEQGRARGSGAGAAAVAAAALRGVGAAESGEDTVADDQLDDVPDGGVGLMPAMVVLLGLCGVPSVGHPDGNWEAGWSALTDWWSELPAQDPVLPWPLPCELRLPPTAEKRRRSRWRSEPRPRCSPCLYSDLGGGNRMQPEL